MVGQRYGRLTGLERRGSTRDNHALWLFRCDCGNECVATGRDVREGRVVSCGCGHVKSMLGEKHGRLTAVEFRGTDARNNSLWLFKCECGKEIVATGHSVRRGNTRSCGCLHLKHGDTREGNIAKIYTVWHSMICRCSYEKLSYYKNYGGRGISVCAEWQSYPIFKEWALSHGYADNLQIDRINNDGNYEPGNCRFVTAKNNVSNQRGTVLLTIDGETACATEWNRRINRSRGLVAEWVRIHGEGEARERIKRALP